MRCNVYYMLSTQRHKRRHHVHPPTMCLSIMKRRHHRYQPLQLRRYRRQPIMRMNDIRLKLPYLLLQLPHRRHIIPLHQEILHRRCPIVQCQMSIVQFAQLLRNSLSLFRHKRQLMIRKVILVPRYFKYSHILTSYLILPTAPIPSQ